MYSGPGVYIFVVKVQSLNLCCVIRKTYVGRELDNNVDINPNIL